MKVLVCGGRDFADYPLLEFWLDRLHHRLGFTALAHGAARGADEAAGNWALRNGLIPERYPADWEAYGKSAGPHRNAEMLKRFEPELVVAFPFPTWQTSRGTKDMVTKARKADVATLVIL